MGRYANVQVFAPDWKWRAVLTVVILALAWGLSRVAMSLQGPIGGSLAVDQVTGGDEEYVRMKLFTAADWPGVIFWGGAVLAGLLWVHYGVRMWKYHRATSFALILAALVGMSGCGPANIDIYAECDTDETLIVLNLVDKQDQAQLDSLEALEKGQISAKRIKVPMHKHGYGYTMGSYQRVADAMIIKVDRSVVSRELTKDPFTGSSEKDQAMEVSSIDGIKYSLGATISAKIEEADAARYVYFNGIVPEGHGSADVLSDDSLLAGSQEYAFLASFSNTEKLLFQAGYIDQEKKRVPYVKYIYRARPLSEVVEHEVVAFCQAELSNLNNAVPLEEGKMMKVEFFKTVFQDAKAFFKQRGVTLTVFGSVKGLQYENGDVQEVTDSRFEALNSITIAEQDRDALRITNDRMIDMAIADRDAAWQFLAAYPAMRMQFEIELRKLMAERRQILQLGWDGQTPKSVLPAGEASPNLLMNLSGS